MSLFGIGKNLTTGEGKLNFHENSVNPILNQATI